VGPRASLDAVAKRKDAHEISIGKPEEIIIHGEAGADGRKTLSKP